MAMPNILLLICSLIWLCGVFIKLFLTLPKRGYTSSHHLRLVSHKRKSTLIHIHSALLQELRMENLCFLKYNVIRIRIYFFMFQFGCVDLALLVERCFLIYIILNTTVDYVILPLQLGE